jgi:hypothetical protein
MKKTVSALALAVLAGCASTPEELASTPSGTLCVRYATAILNGNRGAWLQEVYRRGETCAPYAAEMAAASAQSQAMLGNLNQRYVAPMAAPAVAPAPVRREATAFLKRQFTQGTNTVCVYDRLGSPVHITIPSTQLCPLTQ